MGYETVVDVVPHVVHYAFENDSVNLEDNDYWRLVEPTAWAENFGPEEFHEDPYRAPVSLRGWTKHAQEDVGKKKRIFGWKWVRDEDDISIVLVNESEYEMVGVVENAIVSENRAAIEAFLKDFADLLDCKSPTIEDNDAIKMTI